MRRYRPYNDDGVTLMARKHKRRKMKGYLKGFFSWEGATKESRRLANRKERRAVKRELS